MRRKLDIVVTAGPTREHLDPVRFLSNPSTGKMGFAVARAAARRGHRVTLIAGPVALPTPSGVKRVDVVSAREMLAAALEATSGVDAVFVSVAAVADWRPRRCSRKKIKKSRMSGTLELVRNPDILKTLSRRRTGGKLKLVGFAAESGDVRSEAVRKCREKGLEMIVANDVTANGAGFGCDTNVVTLFGKDGTVTPLPKMSKLAVAGRIVRECEGL